VALLLEVSFSPQQIEVRNSNHLQIAYCKRLNVCIRGLECNDYVGDKIDRYADKQYVSSHFPILNEMQPESNFSLMSIRISIGKANGQGLVDFAQRQYTDASS